MRDILLTLIIFGAVPFIIRHAYIGIYVWSWISYMNPHRMTYGFAFNMPFAAVTAAALFIGFFVSKEKNRFPVMSVTSVWLAFTMWVILSTFLAIDFHISVNGLIRFLKIQLVTSLMTLFLITNKKKLDYLVWVIVLSIGFFSIKGGIFTLATAGSYRVWGPPDSFIEGNNELALATLMILPLMWYLRQEATNIWIKRGLLAGMMFSIFSIISSYSRGAFLAASVLMLMFWLKSKRKVTIGIALAIIAVSVLSFMPEKWFHRMDTIETYHQDASAMGRINAWHFAYNLALDHPLTGGGFNTFTKELFLKYAPNPLDFHDAHSIYFQVLGQQGFVGLFFFILLWLLTYRLCSKVVKLSKPHEELKWATNLAAMVQLGIISYLVGGAFLGLAYFDLPYHLMTICVLCFVFIQKHLNENSQAGMQKNKIGRTPNAG